MARKPCPRCGTTGVIARDHPFCGGTGKIRTIEQGREIEKPCPGCTHGVVIVPCPRCDGEGYIDE